VNGGLEGVNKEEEEDLSSELDSIGRRREKEERRRERKERKEKKRDMAREARMTTKGDKSLSMEEMEEEGDMIDGDGEWDGIEDEGLEEEEEKEEEVENNLSDQIRR